MKDIFPKDDRPVTLLLSRAAAGDDSAKEELYQLIYDDLRDAARRVIRDKYRGTLQTTALVHESLMRFENADVMDKYSKNRRVFFSVAVRAMQQILIDQYRRRSREAQSFDPLDKTIEAVESESGFAFEDLNAAIDELRESSLRQHAVVTHRFFGGLTVAEIAELLDVSTGTIERDWRLARARLLRSLRR